MVDRSGYSFPSPLPSQSGSTARPDLLKAPVGPAARCRICSGEAAFAFCAQERMIGTLDRFDYEKCAVCGALQIASVPEELERYYAEDYYTKRQRRLTSPRIGRRAFRRSWSSLRLRDAGWIRLISGRRYGRFDWFRRT